MYQHRLPHGLQLRPLEKFNFDTYSKFLQNKNPPFEPMPIESMFLSIFQVTMTPRPNLIKNPSDPTWRSGATFLHL